MLLNYRTRCIGRWSNQPSAGNETNVIEYVQIMTDEGNAIDFGDLI